jgi:hypothetical protein
MDERRAMVQRDGVSVFETDIVIQSAKGIGGRRDRRRLPRQFALVSALRVEC